MCVCACYFGVTKVKKENEISPVQTGTTKMYVCIYVCVNFCERVTFYRRIVNDR